MANQFANYEPQRDAGLGLIFRLNDLWRAVDLKFINRDFVGANFVLDRIYDNLLYRNEMDIKTNGDGEIIHVDLVADDKRVHRYFAKKLAKIRGDEFKARKEKNVEEFYLAKKRYYDQLLLKSNWLRKLMQDLGLYLKESERNPATALFGGKF